MRVFDEEEHILGNVTGNPPPRDIALQLECGGVGEGAEWDRPEGAGHGHVRNTGTRQTAEAVCRLQAHACSIFPIESSTASATASDNVGCAWIARSISSTVYSFSRATTSS